MELLKSALWAIPILLACFKAREECIGKWRSVEAISFTLATM